MSNVLNVLNVSDVLNVSNVLDVLDVLNVLDVLDVLQMRMCYRSPCTAWPESGRITNRSPRNRWGRYARRRHAMCSTTSFWTTGASG